MLLVSTGFQWMDSLDPRREVPLEVTIANECHEMVPMDPSVTSTGCHWHDFSESIGISIFLSPYENHAFNGTTGSMFHWMEPMDPKNPLALNGIQ